MDGVGRMDLVDEAINRQTNRRRVLQPVIYQNLSAVGHRVLNPKPRRSKVDRLRTAILFVVPHDLSNAFTLRSHSLSKIRGPMQVTVGREVVVKQVHSARHHLGRLGPADRLQVHSERPRRHQSKRGLHLISMQNQRAMANELKLRESVDHQPVPRSVRAQKDRAGRSQTPFPDSVSRPMRRCRPTAPRLAPSYSTKTADGRSMAAALRTTAGGRECTP